MFNKMLFINYWKRTI